MCDTFVVVADGGVFFGKNSDRDANEAQLVDWIPAADHDEETLACTWRTIPQVRRTHAVILSRPFWMWGGEMGANEHGVVIGNEAVFTDAAPEPTGLLGMDLIRLGLERASTAEEAVAVIVALLGRYGQGGRAAYDDPGFSYDNSFVIADATGAFVLETAGRDTAVERVHGARAISNGLSIPAFVAAHDDRLRSTVAQCRTRRARVEALAASVRRPADVAAVLRDHGPGGTEPRYHVLNGAMAAPCMHAGGLVASGQTVGSWVAHLRPGEARHWVTGTAAPCLSGFKPVALDLPIDLGAPTGRRDERSVWWRFEALHRRVVGDAAVAGRVRAARDAWERWDEAPSEDVWERWDAFVAEQLAAHPRADDRRPALVRRHWSARDRDARATKLPPWRESGVEGRTSRPARGVRPA